jgi:hypothetical protein
MIFELWAMPQSMSVPSPGPLGPSVSSLTAAVKAQQGAYSRLEVGRIVGISESGIDRFIASGALLAFRQSHDRASRPGTLHAANGDASTSSQNLKIPDPRLPLQDSRAVARENSLA